GLKTNRDAWVYNSSLSSLKRNIDSMIKIYDRELDKCNSLPSFDFDNDVTQDPKLINWTRGLRGDFLKGKKIDTSSDSTRYALYRPYTTSWVFYSKQLNELQGQIPKIFPSNSVSNLVIML